MANEPTYSFHIEIEDENTEEDQAWKHNVPVSEASLEDVVSSIRILYPTLSSIYITIEEDK